MEAKTILWAHWADFSGRRNHSKGCECAPRQLDRSCRGLPRPGFHDWPQSDSPQNGCSLITACAPVARENGTDAPVGLLTIARRFSTGFCTGVRWKVPRGTTEI